MKKNTLTDKIFNFYAAPTRLLDVFVQRTHKDAEKMHETSTSFTDQFSSPHMQSYGRNAMCTAIVLMTSVAAVGVFALSPLAGFAAYTVVAAKSVQALKVEEKYQAKLRMERKLAAM